MTPAETKPPILAANVANPWRRWWFVVPLLAALAALFFWDPAQHHFYPRCALKACTGLSCPGCGGLRAVHAALHGDMGAAWRLNPLLFVVGPVLALGAAWVQWHRGAGRAVPGFSRPAAWIWLLLAVIVVFGVARNLPFPPFNQFAA